MKIINCDICNKEVKVRLSGFKIFVKTKDNHTLSPLIYLDKKDDICADCYDIILKSKWEPFS